MIEEVSRRVELRCIHFLGGQCERVPLHRGLIDADKLRVLGDLAGRGANFLEQAHA